MTVSAIASTGLHQAEAGFGKAAAQFTGAAETADSVSLSDAAVAMIENRNAYSANIQTLKVADQIEQAAIGLIG